MTKRLVAIPCPHFDTNLPDCTAHYCPIYEQDGQLVISCSEHGDTPLYVEEDGVMRPLIWDDLGIDKP